MGLRHVWEKYNLKYNYEEKPDNKQYSEYIDFNGTGNTLYLYTTDNMAQAYSTSSGVFLFYYMTKTEINIGDEITLEEGTCYFCTDDTDISGTQYAFLLNETTTFIYELDDRTYYFRPKDGSIINRSYYSQKKIKGSKISGYVANSSPSKYPKDSYVDKYWYVYVGSDSIDPTAVSIPTSINLKNTSNITAISTLGTNNVYGGTITYNYEYITNVDTSWVTAGTTKENSYTINSLPANATNLQFRVKATDSYGYSSADYIYSNTAVISNNNSPVISGSDSHIGIFSTDIPSFTYTVTDEDGNTVTVTEKLDNTVKNTYTAILGSDNTVTFTSDEWIQVLNGDHTLQIIADDGNNGITIRSITFTKNVTSLSAKFATPLTADANVTAAVESMVASLPTGCECKIEACNNGFDESPTWEDVTARVLANEKFMLTNTTKTADNWGYNVRISISRGTATGEVSFFGLSGFFE